MRPVVFYIDDQAHNLTIFEASLPDEWDVYTYDNPIEALKYLEEKQPWVILSDQRMPTMKGVEFLELAKKIVPEAVRIIVTGYSDEDLVIESVRKAQVFDYFRKPWETDNLITSIQRAIDFYTLSRDKERLLSELKAQQEELKEQANSLLKVKYELENAVRKESDIRKELECWVPPFVLWAIEKQDIKFPIKKDLIGITFDIISSSKLHGKTMENTSMRKRVLEIFSEAVMRHGGWRESHAGDSAYAHFGLIESKVSPAEAALATAREFRVGLRGLSKTSGFDVECGIALHLTRETTVDVHTIQISTPQGIKSQKSFDTTSPEVDMLHRIEKLVHDLPGTNIIMTAGFISQLSTHPERLIRLGKTPIRGQDRLPELYLIPSDMLNEQDLNQFIKNYFSETIENLESDHGDAA